ncbi:MAG: polysaccharide biosynthesis/export family protein [Salinivirgaceae bacterium]|nr:polysaccharide biosynthesis/export family protein [Salinivirgaceae bacterium]
MIDKSLTKQILLGILILLYTSGCKVLNPSVMFQTESDFEYNDFAQEHDEYVIRPFDKLDLRIYTNDGYQLIDMESSSLTARSTRNSSPYMVEHDGVVKVPTLGRIEVAGLTIKQVEEFLEGKYSKFYQKPFVLVNVTNRRVVVFNSGSTNGTVLNMENEKFTLIEALAQSGGVDDFSKSYKIKLLRGNLKNPEVYLFNIRSIEEMKKANVVLQANDIIYVEKRPRYVTRTLGEIMPYITIINTVALLYITFNALK